MPFKTSDVDKYNKGLTRKEKRKWSAIANSSLKACIAKGGTDETCAPKAIQVANGVIKRDKEKEAMAKLKTEQAIIDTPEPIQAGDQVDKTAEYYGDEVDNIPFVPSGVVNFDQLDQLAATQEMSAEIRSLTGMYTQMVNNIVYWFEGDKVGQLRQVSTQFADRLDLILNGEEVPMPEAELQTTDQPPTELTERFAEAESSQVISLEEAEMAETEPITRLNVAIIRPGWGNTRDNNYYPAEMLQACSEHFIGAKMYETDHRQDEKSTRTWVSTITEIAGYTDDGAPIARVAIHNPDFAQRVKNLNAAGLIQKMECSIYANGKAETGFELGGRKGKKVLEITDVESVDWVTRAGAGGQVLGLAESETIGGDQMNDTPTTEANLTPVEQPEQVAIENVENTAAVVAITENETTPPASESTENDTPVTTTEQAQEQTVNDAPVCLVAETVRSLLEASRLPLAAQERLSEDSYADQPALDAAIESERAYLAKVLEAGKVFGMGVTGDGSSHRKSAREREALKEQAAQRVNNKFFGSGGTK